MGGSQLYLKGRVEKRREREREREDLLKISQRGCVGGGWLVGLVGTYVCGWRGRCCCALLLHVDLAAANKGKEDEWSGICKE
jgi:hypothetical protein